MFVSDYFSLIFYVVDLSGYNRFIREDSSVIRLIEDFNYWSQIATRDRFKDLPYILIFNQKDIFQNKLLTETRLFSDFFS